MLFKAEYGSGVILKYMEGPCVLLQTVEEMSLL